MTLQLRRIILFTADVQRLASFYQEVLGLPVVSREPGWVDLDAGGCRLAIHGGGGKPGTRTPKLVFHAPDVAAVRAALVKRGATAMGPVKSTAAFDMCDGRDLDGNRFQISSRA